MDSPSTLINVLVGCSLLYHCGQCQAQNWKSPILVLASPECQLREALHTAVSLRVEGAGQPVTTAQEGCDTDAMVDLEAFYNI